jgi:hypothetical protein
MLLKIHFNCSGRLIPAFDTKRQAYSRYQMIGFPLSVVCSGSLIEMKKPHFFSEATEIIFLQFK